MNISFGRCEEILKTLPIGFYLGHKVTVVLDPKSSDTYINMNDEKITISYKCIVNMCANAKDTCNTEEIIRGLLYHEISHALLSQNPNNIKDVKLPKRKNMTPEKKRFLSDNWKIFYNIFEDERIETILAKYYYGVNFKRNLVLLNNLDPKKELATTTDPIKKFYIAVRYRCAPKTILNKISVIIHKFYTITSEFLYNSVTNAELYLAEILNLAYNFLDKLDNKSQQNSQQQNESSDPDDTQDADTTENESQENDTKSANIIPESTDVDDASLEKIANEISQHSQEPGILSSNKIKQIFRAASLNYDADAMSARIEKVIRIATSKHNAQSSGSAAYAGRIDPRLCRNDDYKWWLKKTDTGSNKRFTKIHFNLFCDNSGSFISSMNKMNGLILALRKLEEKNKDFSVTFVHCGYGVKLADPDNPYLDCNNGSILSKNTPELYNSIQKANATNVNLVVFDGSMSGNDNLQNQPKSSIMIEAEAAFKAFNHRNCIVISDEDNLPYFEQYAPNARCTFLKKDYAEKFIEAIMSQLERMLV